jgi:polysaccharide export outer membrane protein
MIKQAKTFLRLHCKAHAMTVLVLVVLVSMLTSACTAISPTDDFAASGSTADYQGGDYQIGPEDVLEISVWREDSLQRDVLVRPDGGISFPLVGDVQAAGKTPEELQAVITERLQRYIPEPVVTVTAKEVAGYRIYVLGQVNNPGQFVVGRYVDVLQALTLAGGLTPYASENNIKILRRENGDEVVFPFNYSAVKRGQNLDRNILLKSDDVVVVP